jgi:ubiquinol-cytochrome c reductase cytochrome b/c1 subunit
MSAAASGSSSTSSPSSRSSGVDYIHALMTGYKEKPPAGLSRCRRGTFYNDYFPGHALSDAAAALRQARRLHRWFATRPTSYAKDVAAFMIVGRRAASEARKPSASR